MSFQILTLFLCLTASAMAADPFLQEPPLKLTVTVGGKEVTLAPGEEKKVEGEFKDPAIKVSIASQRTFSLGGISFKYPADWNWQAEKIEGGYHWTMNGPVVALILGKYDGEVDGKQIAEEVAGAHKVKPGKWAATHGGREFNGWKVTASVGGQSLQYYVFNVPVKDGSAVFQLTEVADDGQPSAELRATLTLLGKTLNAGVK